MPGRLIATYDQNKAAAASRDRIPDTAHSSGSDMASSLSTKQEREVDHAISPARINGHNGSDTQISSTNVQSTAATNQRLPNGTVLESKGSTVLPPDLEQAIDSLPPEIIHITANYHSFSKLLDRVSQECFNSLNETVNELADLPEVPQTNGNAIANTATTIASAQSATKRLKWLSFASDNRERFVKLLVLLQWSRRVEDVGKIIDLVAWMNSQTEAYEHIEYSLGLLKRGFHTAKVPNPNIKTAVEVLATGRSAEMPNLDYIPPPPLTATNLLKKLREINILLHIRINLHEELPKPLQKFKISSGRVTFTIPNEFEVDLSIADDKPTSQFYFIDFRFLCFQRSEIPTDQLRFQFESKINTILASDGLIGCYNFLHNFVVNHKVNILRMQALELARGFWAGSLYIQYVHRTLVVQYWTDRPGKKSWVEIGIAGGRHEHGYTAISHTRLSMRWMRQGKEVHDTNLISLDKADLKMEDILKNVIAIHTLSILSQIHREFAKTFIPCTRARKALKLARSFSEPCECALQLPLKTRDKALVRIEHVSGKFAITPTSVPSRRCTTALNKMRNPIQDAFGQLKWWLTSEVLHVVDELAQSDSWRPAELRSVNRMVLREICRQNDEPAVYMPWPSIDHWKIIITANPSGLVNWWVHQSDHQSFHRVYPSGNAPSVQWGASLPSDGFCQSIRQLLAAELCSRTISLCLARRGCTSVQMHDSVRLSASQADQRVAGTTTVWTDRSNFSPVAPSAFKKDLIGIQFLRFEPVQQSTPTRGVAKAIYLVKGDMANAKSLFGILSNSKIDDCCFKDDGRFAFRIRATVESDELLKQIQDKLAGVERLRQWSSILAGKKMLMKSVSLSSIEFTYAKDVIILESNEAGKIDESKRDLAVSILFGERGPKLRIQATLSPEIMNPHHRIQNHLVYYLRKLWELDNAASMKAVVNESKREKVLPIGNPLSAFLLALDTTLGVMLAFDFIELRNAQGPTSAVMHTHKLSRHKISYRYPQTFFTITGTQDDMGFYWIITSKALRQLAIGQHISNFTSTNEAPQETRLHSALKAFFKDVGSAEGRVLLPHGVAVPSKSVHKVLMDLDKLVRSNSPSPEEIAATQQMQVQAQAPADNKQDASTAAKKDASTSDSTTTVQSDKPNGVESQPVAGSDKTVKENQTKVTVSGVAAKQQQQQQVQGQSQSQNQLQKRKQVGAAPPEDINFIQID